MKPIKCQLWCLAPSKSSLSVPTHAQSLSPVVLFCNPMDCSPPGSSVHGILQENTEVDCHFLLQGIFPMQGSNPCLLLGRRIPYHLSHRGSPLLPCNILTISLSYDSSTLSSLVLTCRPFCQCYSLSWSIFSIVYPSISIFKNIYLSDCTGSWLQHMGSLMFTATCGIFSSMWTLSCSTCDLVLWPGIKLRPPELGTWSLSHWTTREVSQSVSI